MNKKLFSGFASPAEDFRNSPLDLNELLIRHSFATFFFRLNEVSSSIESILPGSILIVDRSIRPSSNDIVLVNYGGEVVLRRFTLSRNLGYLVSDLSFEDRVAIGEGVEVFGVVSSVVYQYY